MTQNDANDNLLKALFRCGWEHFGVSANLVRRMLQCVLLTLFILNMSACSGMTRIEYLGGMTDKEYLTWYKAQQIKEVKP